jgi:hypothetical protein|tara:strand:+ start:1567 stop:1878 length:312 start_codon:yes stop_codon:yes gene_type:complete
LDELQAGRIIVFEAPTQRTWEESTIPIGIRIREGLLSYKITEDRLGILAARLTASNKPAGKTRAPKQLTAKPKKYSGAFRSAPTTQGRDERILGRIHRQPVGD